MPKQVTVAAHRNTVRQLVGCPWCGHEPLVEKWHGGGPRKTRVGCDNPYCPANPSVCQSTRAAAVRLWNKRHPNAQGHVLTRSEAEGQ
jgi:hypothetical protein